MPGPPPRTSPPRRRWSPSSGSRCRYRHPGAWRGFTRDHGHVGWTGVLAQQAVGDYFASLEPFSAGAKLLNMAIDGKLQPVEQARSISDESLQNAAGYGSRLYRGPYFWIARPGTFGSSGHHLKDRRTYWKSVLLWRLSMHLSGTMVSSGSTSEAGTPLPDLRSCEATLAAP